MAHDPVAAKGSAGRVESRHGRPAARRMAAVAVGAALLMVVLVLASSSERLDVWQVPTGDSGVPTEVTDPPQDVPPEQPGAQGRSERPEWVDTLTHAVAIVVVAAAIVLVLMSLRLVRVPSFILYSLLRRRTAAGEVLPEFDEHGVVVDVEAARAALSAGTARNAIVACWMQLERDAADAGLERRPSETPTEYVERVIGRSSVDRAPIAELAALYREARFSRHDLGDEHRRRALVALERVAGALRHHDHASGTVEA